MTDSIQPNIILITTDEQRWDALGINNPAIQTPFLDSLAASGTNFTRCYSTCPVCMPARRTLVSGLHPSNHGTIGNQEGTDFTPPTTVPQLLSDKGYQTQLVGKFHVGIPGKRYGFDHIIQSETPNDRRDTEHQRRNDYADWLDEQGVAPHTLSLGVMSNDRMARPYHLPEQYHHNNWVTDRAADFLCKYRDPDSPFYLHLSYWAPHQPSIPPQAYWDRYKDNEHNPFMGEWTTQDEWKAGVPPMSTHGPFRLDEMRQAHAGYYGLINHMDDQLNYLFDRWSCSKLKNDRPLLIIFTSDHGDLMGDHHLFRKHQAYEGSSHVPLFMCGRNGMKVPQGPSNNLVSLEDVAATVMDAAGIERPSHFTEDDGTSLLQTVNGDSPAREYIHGHGFAGGPGGRCYQRFLVTERYKYIRHVHTGEEQLFDMQDDPKEITDVSGSTDEITALRAVVDEHRDSMPPTADPENAPSPEPCAGARPRGIWG